MRSTLSGAPKRLTHGQYEELRGYEDGNPKWRFGGPPSKSLTRNGWLEVGKYGYSRADCFFQITEAGRVALIAYRERWKVPA